MVIRTATDDYVQSAYNSAIITVLTPILTNSGITYSFGDDIRQGISLDVDMGDCMTTPFSDMTDRIVTLITQGLGWCIRDDNTHKVGNTWYTCLVGFCGEGRVRITLSCIYP